MEVSYLLIYGELPDTVDAGVLVSQYAGDPPVTVMREAPTKLISPERMATIKK